MFEIIQKNNVMVQNWYREAYNILLRKYADIVYF